MASNPLIDAVRQFTAVTPSTPGAAPEDVRSLVRRWSQPGPLSPVLQASTPQARAAVRNIDTERVQDGSRPLTNPAAARALTAASTGEKVTEEDDGGFFSDLLGDVKDLGTGLVHLPQALVSEVLDIPEIPGQVAERWNAGETLQEKIGNVATAKGVRFLPGAFIAAQTMGDASDDFGGGGGTDMLLEHPLFTALDALPYASRLARAAPTVKAARTTAAAEAAATGAKTARVAPLTTVARFGARTKAGALEPTLFGRGVDAGVAGAKRTAAGRALSAAFGKDARAMARIGVASLDDQLRQLGPASPAAAWFRTIGDEADKAGITAERMAEITRGMEQGDEAFLASLTADEAHIVSLAERATRELGDEMVRRGGVARVGFSHGDELYDAGTARRLNAARAAEDMAVSFNDRMGMLRDPSRLGDADSVLAGTARTLGETGRGWSVRRRLTAAKMDLEALRGAGYNVTDLLRTAKTVRSTADLDRLAAAVEAARTTGLARVDSTAALTDFATRLAALRGQGNRAAAVIVDRIQRGDLTGIRREIARVKAHPSMTGVDWAGVFNRLDARSAAGRYEPILKDLGVDGAALKRATRVRALTERQAVPARFQPVVGKMTREQISKLVATAPYLTPDQAGVLAQQALDGIFANIPESVRYTTDSAGRRVDQFARISKDVRASWQSLAEQGLNPRFVHRVTEAGVRRMMDPQPIGSVPRLSQVSKRMWDASDTISNVAVAVQAQAFEIIAHDAMRQFLTQVDQGWGQNLTDLVARYEPKARAKAAATGRPVREELRSMIAKEWAVLDEAGVIEGKRVQIPELAGKNARLIPRHLEENLRRLTPKDPKAFGSLMDPAMRVFRTGLLALSPRWHLNNHVGNAIMIGLEQPGALLRPRMMRQAWTIAKDGVLPEGLPPTALRASTEWMRGLSKMPAEAKLANLQQFAAGRFLGRLYTSARNSRLGGAGGKLVEKSYRFAEFSDDFYRSLSYLYGTDKTLKRGLSKGQAAAEGVAAARRVLMEWDTMTPLERGVIRNVMPFYSFQRHLIGYVTRFPQDHPLRLAVMSSIVNNELQDMGTGLPAALRSLIFIGDPDPGGTVTAINPGTANPFRDVGNMAALLGFVTGQEGGNAGAFTSQLNPFMGAFMRAVGMDPQQGMPDLYAEVAYDPATGGLKVEAPNPIQAFAEGISPQFRGISGLIGWNDEFREVASRDPEAGLRMLLGSFGVPALVRTANPAQDTAEAEVRRYNAMREAASSGDPARWRNWPELAAYSEQAAVMANPRNLNDLSRLMP